MRSKSYSPIAYEKMARMIKMLRLKMKKRKIKKLRKTVLVKRKVRMASTLRTFQMNNKYCDITLVSADGAWK